MRGMDDACASHLSAGLTLMEIALVLDVVGLLLDADV